MAGVISGGWAFVWAAYIVSALVIFGYTVRTFVQNRSAR